MNAIFRKKRVSLPGTAVFLVLFIFSVTAASPAGKSYRIVANSASPYTIVLAGDASPSEKHAAAELQKFLKLASGAELPVVGETDPRAARAPRFLIGPGKLARELSGIEDSGWNALGNEGFIIRLLNPRASAPDILIAGGRLRGSLYGVYTFLDHIGFRWYTNRVTVFPNGPDLDIPPLNEQVIPDFMYREPSITEAFDADWAARNRVNSFSSGLDADRGGKVGVLGVHTFDRLIPPSLFAEHPEYFPLIGGKRSTGYVQRCLTAPGLAEVTAANLIRWMDENPEVRIFCLSQADADNLCECPECTRIMREEGSPAGLYLGFVNRVAEIVEKKHPDKLISTLAYTFTEKPPKTVRPRKNVIIRLCPISLCSSHPFTECTEQAARNFRANLEGWSKLTDRIFIWHYATDFSNFLMPFPDFREFAANIRLYRARGVKGIFMESSEISPGGSDADLRAWVMTRLLWNPDLNPDRLVDEWMHGVYGDAYPPMRAYFDLMHRRVSRPDRHLHIFDAPDRDRWPDTVAASMDSLFRDALRRAAGNSVAEYYVRKNHLSVTFLRTILGAGHLELKGDSYRPEGNTLDIEDADRFITEAKASGITTLGGDSTDSSNFTLLRQRYETHPTVSIENPELKIVAVPDLGGRIIAILDKRTGQNFLSPSAPINNFYPSAGGYEEMTALTWGCTGFANRYEASISGRALTLATRAGNGLEFRRVITLPESGGAVRFESSITNQATDARTCRLVCRAELAGDFDRAKLLAAGPDGAMRVPVPTEVKDSPWPYPQKNYRYDGPNKPEGSWRMEYPGWTVESRFDPAAVASFNLIRASGVGIGDIMELHTPEKVLAPGESIAMRHTLDFSGK